MFAFAVVCNETGRKGSVVSEVTECAGELYVAVMWDDDLTFGTMHIGELTGNPINMPDSKPSLSIFPGGKDDPENSTH